VARAAAAATAPTGSQAVWAGETRHGADTQSCTRRPNPTSGAFSCLPTMRYKLLVLDVDGTLLDSRHQLPPRVAAAIRAAQDAGLPVALATGKLLRSVAPLVSEMELRGPQITLNGAALVDALTGKPYRFTPLREDDRKSVIEAVRRVDPTVLVSHFALNGIYIDEDNPFLSVLVAY